MVRAMPEPEEEDNVEREEEEVQEEVDAGEEETVASHEVDNDKARSEGDDDEDDDDDDNASSTAVVSDEVLQLVRQQVPPQQQQQQQQQQPKDHGEDPALDPNQTYILAGPYTRYDPRSQTYINFFSARPVPKGMTVIAAPIMHYASAALNPNAVTHAVNGGGNAPSGPKQASMLQTFTARSANAPASPSAPPIFPGAPPTTSLPSSSPGSASPSVGGFNPNAAPFFPKKSSSNSSLTPSVDGKARGKRTTPCFMYWSSQHPEGTLIPFRQPQPPVYFPHHHSAAS